MAYAALVSLSQTLPEHVIDGDQHQIKSLQENVSFLQSFLEEYPQNNGGKVDSLERRIREAAYRAEDVVELCISNQVSMCNSLTENGFMQDHCGDLQESYYINLRTVLDQIDSIVEEAKERKRSCITEDSAPSSLSVDALSIQAPSDGQETAVGFENDLINMKDRLCGESTNLRIISIVGMGGIGKTTLAKTISDDSLVAYHFDIRAWITLSHEYLMRDILLSLSRSLGAMENNLRQKSDEKLAEHVYKSLKGRRYLIIMDDMWSTKAWDDMRRILPNDNNGSRVIITSRLLEVATYADSSSPPHQVQLLNADQSWTLLQQKVFGHEPCPLEFGENRQDNCGRMWRTSSRSCFGCGTSLQG